MNRVITFGRRLDSRLPASTAAEWQQSDAAWIGRAVERVQAKPGGGWFVIDACRRLGDDPCGYRIAGRDIVVWRAAGRLHAAPDECPHMGASLASGCVRGDRLVCPWHGLALGAGRHGAWRPLPVHDDGVLLWVRLDNFGELPSDRPMAPARPADAIDAVIRLEARCEPEDVLWNRLDPWHGVHFHPHAFRRLKLLEQQDDELTVRVAWRVFGPFAVEVDARFHCPDPRTIVMTIVGGDGIGSVVETHATPIAPGLTAIVEATLACSDRAAFPVVRRLARLVRPWMRREAARLWADDLLYVERRHVMQDNRMAAAAGEPHNQDH